VTTEELKIQQARQAVASPYWQWRRGMVLIGKQSPLILSADVREAYIVLTLSIEDIQDTVHLVSGYLVDGVWHWRGLAYSAAPLPDVSHPSVLSFLRDQVRQLRDEPDWTPKYLKDGSEDVWVSEKPSKKRQTRYSSEVDAILSQLTSCQLS